MLQSNNFTILELPGIYRLLSRTLQLVGQYCGLQPRCQPLKTDKLRIFQNLIYRLSDHFLTRMLDSQKLHPLTS